MATQADLFADARKCMVDSQIRPNRVTDPRLLSALRRLPRERFLPQNVWSLAYTDEDVPLGNGRFLMEPMVFAKLLQAAEFRENERVLVIGAGTGYGAAVLAACGCKVTALEEDAGLLAFAGDVLPTEAPGVTLVAGPLAAGWPAHAPYDLILIEGAVPEIPSALAGSDTPGNRPHSCAYLRRRPHHPGVHGGGDRKWPWPVLDLRLRDAADPVVAEKACFCILSD